MADADYTSELEGSDDTAMQDLDGLSRKLIAWVKQDMPKVSKWRKEAREDFGFYTGGDLQWSDEDKNELRAKNRPTLSISRIGPLVNAITGSEINNRREVRYLPREQGDAQANEVLSAAAEWFRDECGAEDEESDAFQDAVITGMGWCDTRLDFDDDPDGAPLIERIDCLEMGWDRYAAKPNLEDAKRLWRVRELSYDDARDLTGEKDKTKLHAGWIKGLNESDPHDQDKADLYLGGQGEFTEDGYDEKKCLIVEIRWIEKKPVWRGPDLETGELRDYSEKQFQMLRKAFPAFQAVKQQRKMLRRAFLGSEVLGEPDSPLVPPGTGLFGWECITGYRDKINRQFYGVVRACKDPQRWSNKFFSQVMFLLNSQSKGGIIAERGAFEDDRQAEASWAKSDVITWALQGSLSGQNPKIMPKNPAQFPAGFFTLFQETKESISQVTGLSQEFIGTREVDQAGVLEYQRRQSSLNLLASLFNGLRRYRKRQGRVMLYLIQEHLADGRLIRIVGEGLSQYVPLTHEQVANARYDIIVDDSPSSPNEKERTWQILMQFLPLIKELIISDPMAVVEVLEASPLPPSFVEKVRKMVQARMQQAQQQGPSPEEIKAQGEQQKFQMEMAGKQMEIAGKASDMQAKQAETGMALEAKQVEMAMDTEMKGIDLLIKQREADMKAAVDGQKLQNDMARLAIQERQNEIAAQRAAAQRTKAASG